MNASRPRRAVAAIAAALWLAACGPQGEAADSDGSWLGSITTEGDVTTIVNESGSVWGGTATLVEEASIGVDIGEDAYMFGSVGGTWATDERIYVAASRVPVVRAYDQQGNHLFDIGREGQGPGEYQNPANLMVAPDGLLYVRDARPGGPINVYTQEGEHVDTLRADPMMSSAWPMVYTRDGVLYTPVRANPGDPEARGQAMGVPGPDGVVGEPLPVPDIGFEPTLLRVNERVGLNVAFVPRWTWAMSPSGGFVVGIADDYRFEIHEPSGHVTVVRRDPWEREAVDPEEAEWSRRQGVRSGRRFVEGFNWDGAEIPAYKPAYSSVTVDTTGRIWVTRRSPARRVQDCDEDPLDVTEGSLRPCWEYDLIFDLFDEEGRLLSSGIEAPPELTALYNAYIGADTFIASMEDEAGTIMVKRYRLVRPEEE